MSHGDPGETCKFGHLVLPHNADDPGSPTGAIDGELLEKIQKGKAQSLEDIEGGIGQLTGDPFKTVKLAANSQGMPRAAALDAADKFDEDLDYTVKKTEEKIFVSPQSNLHNDFMQRKQQAEQNVKSTMQNISQLTKQKHMLEHDIRKLRSRAEAMRSGNEDMIKGDFVELVDGAGGGGQGGDEASLKFYRDNNIYPSIVADFQEMRSLEDLKEPEESELDNPRLHELPENEKAILRKKWAMYEKWKDLYGSEVQRKLKELKQQLHSVENSIDQTKEWLEPYVRDMVMINEESVEDLKADMGLHITFKGESNLIRKLEFIAYRPMENSHGTLKVIEDRDKATHYRIVHITVLHVNLAGWEQPQSPAQGPSAALIEWHPVIACRHVFENFFQEKIKKQENLFENVLQDYKGEISTSEGDKLREARESMNLQVRELREEVDERVDEKIPIEFSSTIRRVEDGLESPRKLDGYGGDENILEVIEEVLEMDEGFERDEKKASGEMYSGINKKVRTFTGQVDEFVLPPRTDPLDELKKEMKFNFYYDWKIAFDLFTMK